MELRNLFRRKRPPVLYKYFPPKRIDVLQNGQLRFTQTLLFNDPFESSPSFSELAPKTLMERVSKIEAARTGMPEEERQRILAFIYADPENRTRVSLVGQLLIEALARGVGILSLTESADSFLMWAHYAKSHEGFVIGFKTTDSFSSRSGARRDAVHDLRKVRYSKRRPKLKFLTSLDLAEMYFTKSSEWKYEEEWRMSKILPEDDFSSVLEVGLKSIAESTTIAGLPPCPIDLFDFPASCVHTVIVGCRAIEQTQNAIAAIVAAKYPHAEILKATTSATNFQLIFERIHEIEKTDPANLGTQ